MPPLSSFGPGYSGPHLSARFCGAPTPLRHQGHVHRLNHLPFFGPSLLWPWPPAVCVLQVLTRASPYLFPSPWHFGRVTLQHQVREPGTHLLRAGGFPARKPLAGDSGWNGESLCKKETRASPQEGKAPRKGCIWSDCPSVTFSLFPRSLPLPVCPCPQGSVPTPPGNSSEL